MKPRYIQAQELAAAGLSRQEIMVRLSYTRDSLRQALKYKPKIRTRADSEARTAEILAAYRSGMTAEDVIKTFKIHKETLYRMRKKHNVPAKPRGKSK